MKLIISFSAELSSLFFSFSFLAQWNLHTSSIDSSQQTALLLHMSLISFGLDSHKQSEEFDNSLVDNFALASYKVDMMALGKIP